MYITVKYMAYGKGSSLSQDKHLSRMQGGMFAIIVYIVLNAQFSFILNWSQMYLMGDVHVSAEASAHGLGLGAWHTRGVESWDLCSA